MYRTVRRLMLVTTATVASLLLCELFVRAFVAVRNVGPSFSVYDPDLGKRLRRSSSILRVTPEFTMRLTTNSLGFRGPALRVNVVETPRPPEFSVEGDRGIYDGDRNGSA